MLKFRARAYDNNVVKARAIDNIRYNICHASAYVPYAANRKHQTKLYWYTMYVDSYIKEPEFCPSLFFTVKINTCFDTPSHYPSCHLSVYMTVPYPVNSQLLYCAFWFTRDCITLVRHMFTVFVTHVMLRVFWDTSTMNVELIIVIRATMPEVCWNSIVQHMSVEPRCCCHNIILTVASACYITPTIYDSTQ